MKTFFLAAAAATTGLLIAGQTFAPQAANATTHVDAVCRAWDNGVDTGDRFGCTVQFDRAGATAISDGQNTFVRGLHGITNGIRNKECLRNGAGDFAICPIGDFGF